LGGGGEGRGREEDGLEALVAVVAVFGRSLSFLSLPSGEIGGVRMRGVVGPEGRTRGGGRKGEEVPPQREEKGEEKEEREEAESIFVKRDEKRFLREEKGENSGVGEQQTGGKHRGSYATIPTTRNPLPAFSRGVLPSHEAVKVTTDAHRPKLAVKKPELNLHRSVCEQERRQGR
jgi:hypothetical protein